MNNHRLNQSLLFGLLAPIIYLVADIYRFPMFTYFPAANEIHWGWVAMSEELGPGMNWYGWLATATFSAGLTSLILVRGSSMTKVSFMIARYLWLLPILLLVPLIVSLKFYWR
jgi:hypothetical protein